MMNPIKSPWHPVYYFVLACFFQSGLLAIPMTIGYTADAFADIIIRFQEYEADKFADVLVPEVTLGKTLINYNEKHGISVSGWQVDSFDRKAFADDAAVFFKTLIRVVVTHPPSRNRAIDSRDRLPVTAAREWLESVAKDKVGDSLSILKRVFPKKEEQIQFFARFC